MKYFILLILVCSNSAFAQYYPDNKPVPVYFDRFIQTPLVEWASLTSDTIRFDKVNLHEILRNRFEKNEIKACRAIVYNDIKPGITYISKQAIDDLLAWHCNLPIYDSTGEIPASPKKNNDKPAHQFDSTDYNVVGITQLMYVENGRLKVFVPVVAPKISISTSQGIYLGLADYFTTAFNFNHNFSGNSGDKITPLIQTHKIMNVDSVGSGVKFFRLKQLYGRNLLETLWPHVLNNELPVFSVRTNKKLSVSELTLSIIDAPPIVVPAFDSLGNIKGQKNFWEGDLLEHFDTLEIIQNWYYNQTKNIVTCKIPEVILFARMFKNGEAETTASPVLKIIFKN